MTRYLPTNDFRAVRMVLEDDDFALVVGPEVPPSDLIESDVWLSILALPDDVAIRTSNHHGSLLKLMHELWGAWWEAVGSTEDMLYVSLLDAGDDFRAATFNLLHGFYRQAYDSLRSALELTAIGAYYQVTGRGAEFQRWRSGQLGRDFGLGNACDGLRAIPSVVNLETHLRTVLQDDLFRQRNGAAGDPGGWIRRLFRELSNYAHSRPGFTNGDLWHSNGPVYDTRAVVATASYYLQTMAACYVMIKIGRPHFQAPQAAQQLFKTRTIRTLQIAHEAYGHLFQM